MCVQERIMESCETTYDPSVEMEAEEVVAVEEQQHLHLQPIDIEEEIGAPSLVIGLEEEPDEVDWEANISIARRHEWLELRDSNEWSRLQRALTVLKGRSNNN